MPFSFKSCFCGVGEEDIDSNRDHPESSPQNLVQSKEQDAKQSIPASTSSSQPNHVSWQSAADNARNLGEGTANATTPIPPGLWSRAYQQLAKENEDAVKAYEKVLSPTGEAFTSETDMQSTIRTQLQEREAKQWAVHIGNKSVRIRKCGENVVKFLVWSKGVVAAAVSTQPYAAIAMAGISVMLPLFIQASDATGIMMKGLEFTCNTVRLYHLREKLYLEKVAHREFEEAIVKLYQDILRYQVNTVVHLSHNIARRGAENVLQPTTWSDLLSTIENSDKECERLADFIDKDLERRHWIEEEGILERSQEIQEAMLSALADMHGILEAQLDHQSKETRANLLGLLAFDYTGNKDVNPDKVPGTCEWLFGNETFADWRRSDQSSMLVLAAGPGCGKSVLAKYLVDEHKVSESVLASTICHFFFKHHQYSATDALRAVLHQMFTRSTDANLISSALTYYEHFQKSLATNQSELWNMLATTLRNASTGEIVVVLDALDECPAESRQWLMHRLIKLIQEFNVDAESELRLKILATTRPHGEIIANLERPSESLYLVDFEASVPSKQMLAEINIVIEHWVHSGLSNILRRSDQDSLIKKMQKTENRTYLWAHLVFKVIKKKTELYKTAKKLEVFLNSLPDTVNEAYDEILQDCPEPALAKRIFALVLAAKQPLTLSELNIACELLATDADTYSDLDFSTDEQFHDTIRNACRLMLTVIEGRVFLLHQTVAEFLLGPPDVCAPEIESIQKRSWHHILTTADSEATMAKSCMRLLCLDDFRQLISRGTDIYPRHYFDNIKLSGACAARYRDTFVEKDIDGLQAKDIPLHHYAASHWAQHYRETTAMDKKTLLRMALVLCDAGQALFYNWWDERFSDAEGLQTPLIAACSLGLSDVAMKVLSPFEGAVKCQDDEAQCDLAWNMLPEHRKVNMVRKNRFYSALFAATSEGHTAIVAFLLDRGGDINIQPGYTSGLFAAACGNGHLETAKLLLARGVDPLPPRAADFVQSGALVQASRSRHKAVVEWLLQIDLPQHKEHGTYIDALAFAIEVGAAEIVNLFVDATDIGLEPRNYERGLRVLALSSHVLTNVANTLAITQLLIEKGGASVNSTEVMHGTFLNWTCHMGLLPVLKYLLNKDARIDLANTEALQEKIEPEDALQVSLLSNAQNGPAIRAALVERAGPQIITKIDQKGNNRLHLLGKHLYDHNFFVGQRGFHFEVLSSDQIKACYWLVENGVDVNAINNDGRTPGDVFNEWTATLGMSLKLREEFREFFKNTGANSGKVLNPEKWVEKKEARPLEGKPALAFVKYLNDKGPD